ncbi:MAG: alpha/beta fold hydrolase [Tannerellaceae bacterium]|jgi:pimeloyl-ACP methyl ester carboxylesterase|nr:alpha/beta fold hydrolase [Tannerellaceae bacterium]
MKQFLLLSILLFFPVSSCSYSPDITGRWYGSIDMEGFNMRIVFDIKQSGYEYSATMQSPDQTKEEVAVTAVTCDNDRLVIRIDNIDFLYKGKAGRDGIIRGEFTQMGQTRQLNLSHTEIASAIRAQEPAPPFPYRVENVTFENDEAGIRLAGTLTLPEGTDGATAVVLISGSGPQNRNEEMMGHKPFLVLADYLTRQGIAVLRFDDRGVEESQGDYSKATLADFATDVTAAVAYLKTRREINRDKIGLIGHSEGGGIAFMLASQKVPAFVVTLAGMGVTGPELLAMQRKALFQASGVTDEYINQFNAYMAEAQQVAVEAKSAWELREGITRIFTGTPVEKQIEPAIQQLSSPEMVSLLQYNPAEYFKNIRCPVFALNGMRDLQVPSGENLSAILDGITANGNKNVRTKPYFNLNHLFQTAMTGLPNEYGAIEETFNEEALHDLSEWIKER